MKWFRKTPDTAQLIPALTNLSYNITHSPDLRDKHHPQRLAGFVIASTSSTLAMVLDAWPDSRRHARELSVHCRQHFDAAWWLFQVFMGESEEQLSRLFPLVDFQIDVFIKHLRHGAPVAETILRDIVNPSIVNAKSLHAAFQRYVLGDLPANLAHLRNLDVRQCNALVLATHLLSRAPEDLRRDCGENLCVHIRECWDNPLLAGFQLAQCPVIDLPREWLV
jgi:hypothetical protein